MKGININACFAALLLALTLSACSVDSNERANRLYSEAHQALASIDESDVTMDELIDAYSLAIDKLERITSRYPGSDIAVGLISDERKLHGLTMRSIKDRYKSFERLDTFDDLTLTVAAYLWSLDEAMFGDIFFTGALQTGGLAREALKIASNFEDSNNTQIIKVSIASSHHERLPKDEFQRIIVNAENALDTLNSSADKAALLRNLSRAHYVNDERDLAVERFNASLEEGLKLNEPDYSFRLLMNLLELHLEADLSDEPSTLLSKAKKIIEETSQPINRVGRMVGIAILMDKLGEKVRAHELLVNAEALMQEIDSRADRDRAVNSLIRGFASVGDFDTSLKLASIFTFRASKERSYLTIVREMLEQGMEEDAINLSSSIESTKKKTSYYLALSDYYHSEGNIDESMENLKRAEQLVLSEDKLSVQKLVEIADGYAQIGARDNARDLLSKVLSHSHDSTEDLFSHAYNLTYIGVAMRKHNFELTRAEESLVTSIALSHMLSN